MFVCVTVCFVLSAAARSPDSSRRRRRSFFAPRLRSSYYPNSADAAPLPPGLTSDAMRRGFLGVQLGGLAAFFTAPIQLGRGASPPWQPVTLENNLAALSRFLGWYSACWLQQGPRQPPPSLFWLLDGPAVMAYVSHLVHDRSLLPNSVVAAAYSLRSGVHWLAADGARAAPGGLFAGEEVVPGLRGGGDGGGGYMVRRSSTRPPLPPLPPLAGPPPPPPPHPPPPPPLAFPP